MRKFTLAVLSSALGLLTMVSPILAGNSGTLVLRTAPDGKVLTLGDLAAAGNIGVVWQEGQRSYMRWSDDGGDTFAAKVSLRRGLRATDPRLAACGDFLWAASVWRTDTAANVGIDYRQVALGSAGAGRFKVGPGFNPDIACKGSVVALTYSDSAERLRLAIMDGPCMSPCVPAFAADLGPAPEFGLASIAATDRGFVVAWKASGIAVQRVIVEDDGDTLSVELRPPTTLMAGKDAWNPAIDGDGARVVLAYSRRGQTHMRISETRGRTFGSRIIVSEFCRDCLEGGSSPLSVDARSGRILVEVGAGAGTPTAVEERGYLTDDAGQTWTKTPIHTGGTQMGVLLPGSLAEAWDKNVYADPVYGSVAQKLRFHTLALP